MQPRLSNEPSPAKLPVTHVILAGLRVRLPSRANKWLPHTAQTQYCDFSFAAIKIVLHVQNCTLGIMFPDSGEIHSTQSANFVVQRSVNMRVKMRFTSSLSRVA